MGGSDRGDSTSLRHEEKTIHGNVWSSSGEKNVNILLIHLGLLFGGTGEGFFTLLGPTELGDLLNVRTGRRLWGDLQKSGSCSFPINVFLKASLLKFILE